MPDDAYARIATSYDTVLGWSTAALNRRALELAPAGPGDRVLDVGCGTGAHLAGYRERGADCTGLDLSPAMLEVARRRLPGADLRIGDATDLPFDDGSFDLVLATLFLHELAPDARSMALTEMARVAADDGRVVVIDYHVGSLRWQGRLWRVFSTATERVAGGDHYAAWRTYLDEGGLPATLPDTLTIDRTKVVAGGNLALWVMGVVRHG
jgi:ubiquinone/menaquinone biosynthesis C-methylase UbiE